MPVSVLPAFQNRGQYPRKLPELYSKTQKKASNSAVHVLDNPGRLTQMVEESGAHSTDLQSPERACDYCNRCIPAAERWAPVADEIWNSLPNKRGVQLTGKMAKKS